MYKTAHKTFGMGLTIIFAYVFSIRILPAILTVFFGMILSILPDYDIKLGIPHRTVTHSFLFFVIFSFIFTAVVFIISGYIQIFIGSDIITGLYLKEESVAFPIPTSESFYKIMDGQIISIYIAIFIGGLTHIMLDSTTFSGIDVEDVHIEGSFRSGGFADYIFIFIGILMAIVGFIGIINRTFSIFSNKFVYLSIGGVFLLSLSVMGFSYIRRRNRDITKIDCGNINGVLMCIYGDRKCIVDKNGNEKCFDT